ncbi:hypothetical protein GCM10023231_30750 [Olivibacter ginsenosidimutans]|uniref:AraC family transcriptional regulator n=1 Tax=Olivibacter ginsenosidimutans TaxID=1176537 RepID=A0ABP9BSS2_9SPHI
MRQMYTEPEIKTPNGRAHIEYYFNGKRQNAKLTSHVYFIENPDISIYVEQNLIVSISCREEGIYKGRNMIGMFIDEFMKYYELIPIGAADELCFEEDNVPQYVYEFYFPKLSSISKVGTKNNVPVFAVLKSNIRS